MDPLVLARLQFAITTVYHFFFVPLTLGLSIIVAVMETLYVRTGLETYKHMTKFWGKLFIINFAMGVVTGIVQEFQFGMNWSEYSRTVGDIFGAPLAIEALLAFFLESTFLGIWIFGWDKLSKGLHAVAIWLVAIASNVSALWILIANSFMQQPVGYELQQGGGLVMKDFGAVILNPNIWYQFPHTIAAGFTTAAFFVMGISAYHLLRKQHIDFFTKSFRLGLAMALIFSFAEVIQGHIHGSEVAKIQPAKLAAMEALWDTQTNAPQTLFLIPDEQNERNLFEIGSIPGALSMLAYHDPKAEVKGLKAFPKDERPPVTITFVAFRIMVALGFLFPLLTLIGLFKRNKLVNSPGYLKVMLWSMPLPYIALQAGWIVTEVGRQPWIVYGVMKTKDAVSPIATSQVGISFAAFIVVYTILGIVAFYLMRKFAIQGPEPLPAPAKRGEV